MLRCCLLNLMCRGEPLDIRAAFLLRRTKVEAGNCRNQSQIGRRLESQFTGSAEGKNSAQGNTGLQMRGPKQWPEMPEVLRFAKASSNPW